MRYEGQVRAVRTCLEDRNKQDGVHLHFVFSDKLFSIAHHQLASFNIDRTNWHANGWSFSTKTDIYHIAPEEITKALEPYYEYQDRSRFERFYDPFASE